MEKTVVIDHVRVKVYEVISRAVADGVAYGVRRAHKHADHPSEDLIMTEVERHVMNELCDVLQFDDGCGCDGCEK